MLKEPKQGVSPGLYLLDDVIKPLGLSVSQLARDLNIPPNRLYLIINDKRELTVDTAMRLGKYFGTGPELWLYIQMNYAISRYKPVWQSIREEVREYNAKR